MPKRRIKNLHLGSVVALFSIFLLGPGNLIGQQTLTITSPASGTKVAPGQTISIQVSVASGTAFAAVQVIGTDIGVTAPQTAPPYSFTLTVPSDVIGQKSITALGIVSPENGVFSVPITVDSESPANATALSLNYSQISVRYSGQQLPLDVIGAFDDGSHLDVTRSSLVSYASANSAIASVNASGLVTAVGPGTTTVTVAYGAQSAQVHVIVPKSIRGDLNGDGRVDQDDLNIILAALNTPATGPTDARDLNGDGIINIQDAEILISLCTVSKCNLPDLTPPVSSASISPQPNSAGWNNTNVTVTLNSTDNEPGGTGVNEITYSASGAQAVPSTSASAASTSFVINTEGITIITFFGIDNAGNIETAKTVTIKLDKTPPTVTCSASPNVLWPPNNKLAPINASVSVTDSLSGSAGFTLVSVTSNEPDSGQGDVQGFVTGTPSTSGQLRAQRLGSGTGRVYTLTYSGSDRAGNTAPCITTVTVPHDQGQ